MSLKIKAPIAAVLPQGGHCLPQRPAVGPAQQHRPDHHFKKAAS